MTRYIFLLENVFTAAAANQFDNIGVITMDGFASISKHNFIRSVSTLHAEKNWFEMYCIRTSTFHFPISENFIERFKTVQMSRE